MAEPTNTPVPASTPRSGSPTPSGSRSPIHPLSPFTTSPYLHKLNSPSPASIPLALRGQVQQTSEAQAIPRSQPDWRQGDETQTPRSRILLLGSGKASYRASNMLLSLKTATGDSLLSKAPIDIIEANKQGFPEQELLRSLEEQQWGALDAIWLLEEEEEQISETDLQTKDGDWQMEEDVLRIIPSSLRFVLGKGWDRISQAWWSERGIARRVVAPEGQGTTLQGRELILGRQLLMELIQ